MVKHNNIIPNIHCGKKYLQSSRGPLKVKLALDQASRKKSRRVARAARAAALAPAPVQRLYPVVHCPTQKYSAKVRLGKGFTLEELKTVGLHPTYAQTIGIAVDARRRNRCEESLRVNVARLQAYQANLIVLKKGDAAPPQVKTTIQPSIKLASAIVLETVTDNMKAIHAHSSYRAANQETRVAGYRISVSKREKKE
jgi:large subunit ribosomal protein L13e